MNNIANLRKIHLLNDLALNYTLCKKLDFKGFQSWVTRQLVSNVFNICTCIMNHDTLTWEFVNKIF